MGEIKMIQETLHTIFGDKVPEFLIVASVVFYQIYKKWKPKVEKMWYKGQRDSMIIEEVARKEGIDLEEIDKKIIAKEVAEQMAKKNQGGEKN